MADPATLTLALKVIDFAFDANKAIWSSGLGENDYKAVKSLIDAGKAVRGAAAGSPERTLGQAHEDMTLAAFTMAWQTHWGGSQEQVWRQVRKSKKEVAACLATARGQFPPEVDASGKPSVRNLRHARNLDKAILPEGFTFLPEDGPEIPPDEDA